MTYQTREESSYLGEPVELYEFKYGYKTFYYTSSDRNITIATKEYLSVPIKRGKVEKNQDVGRIPLTITLSRTVDLTDLFISSPPSSQILLTIKRFHEDEETAAIVFWTGRMVNIKYYEDTAEIRCESIQTSIKRPALRRFYQMSCPHVLYSLECRAVTTTFENKVDIVGITGLVITIPDLGKPNGYFSGGYISYEAGPALNLRFITSHTGNTITINLPAGGLIPGSKIIIYPGCNHTLETCANKFNNSANYGGFPYIPQLNPFGASSVF